MSFVYYGITMTDPALIIEALTCEIQRYLDSTAREYGYDNIATAITYRGDKNPRFAAEAEGFFAWRSDTWTAAYARLAEVQAGTAPLPSLAELAELLPPLSITYPESQ